MRILVTGGAGFIGSHLVDSLIEGGAEVRCLVRTQEKWLEGKKVAKKDLKQFHVFGDLDRYDRTEIQEKLKHLIEPAKWYTRAISIGYKIHVMERRERKNDVPLHRAIDWEPWEISVISVPFDAGAMIRSADAEEYECRVLDHPETVRARMLARHG
jgi:NAD(P)-dependent dehydrogenase (short-subunit alcohol dehydrogenase family)